MEEQETNRRNVKQFLKTLAPTWIKQKKEDAQADKETIVEAVQSVMQHCLFPRTLFTRIGESLFYGHPL